jgi:hypothetical protein
MAGLIELDRVTAGEVRVFPLVDSMGTVYPRLDDVRAALADRGIRTEIRAANGSWHPGGDQLLACWKSERGLAFA